MPPIVLDGTTGITTPGLTNTGTETLVNLTTTGNTILGDASTDTLNVGNGGLVKDASGNVGIGTASPAGKLHVVGSQNAWSEVIAGNTTSAQSYGMRIQAGTTSADTSLLIRDATNTTDYLAVIGNGSVGIGTSSPNRKLYVQSDDSVTGGNVVGVRNSNATAGAFINFIAGGSNAPSIGAKGDNLVFTADGYAGTEWARFSSGNLLVGTMSSKSKTTIQGQLSVGQTGSASSAAGIYLYASDTLSDNSFLCRVSNGTGTTTWYIGNQAITTSSDIRLKENVKPSERNALDLLNQWEIIDHTWNDPSDQCENNRNSRGVWTGISAQQVQQVTPWLVNKPIEDVNEDGSINPWTMDFGYAVPLLVKAIQEQQAIIQSLTARITALENK